MIISRCYAFPMSEAKKYINAFSKKYDLGLEYVISGRKIKLGTKDFESVNFIEIARMYVSENIDNYIVVDDNVYCFMYNRYKHK